MHVYIKDIDAIHGCHYVHYRIPFKSLVLYIVKTLLLIQDHECIITLKQKILNLFKLFYRRFDLFRHYISRVKNQQKWGIY